jgi:hypothetical protein
VAWLKGHNPFKLPGLSLYSIVCFLVLNFPPLWVTFRNGQINLLVLFLLAASYYAYWKRYPVITGILLALAITTRYTPGIFLLFWLLKKEYRIVRITLLTLFGLVFTSFLVFGWQVHKDYFILGQHYAAYVKLHYNYFANITLYSLLSNIKAAGYLPIGFPALGVQLGFAILITGLTAIITFKSPADRYYALEYGLFGAMLPLLSYFGENHHFTFTLLGFITALGYSLRKEIGLLLALCWLLIYSGYYCEEVLLLPQLSFWKNYIDWLGVFCGYLMLLFILNDFKKKSLSYDRSNSN